MYNDYADEDIPDVDPSDFLTANEEPDVEPSVSSSHCPVPPPADGMRPASPSPSHGGLRGGCCVRPYRGTGEYLPIGYVDTGLYEGGRRDWPYRRRT